MEPKLIKCLETKPAEMPLLKEELYRADAHDFNLVRVDANVNKPPHPYTAGDSIMLILKGQLELVVDEKPYPLEAGTLAIIPKGALRGFTTGPEGVTFFAIHLRG